ncbi:MAG: hypothetical protein JWO30_4638 [Fibrobacteres bacterium]|nr:hypothetical protein [Fibrobacterota bacterium]
MGTGKMKAVIFYETANVPMEKIMEAYPRHKKLVDAFHAKGEVIAIGTWANPMEGSMGVFANRDAAERFVKEDPFVSEGIVAKATIRDWKESLLG